MNRHRSSDPSRTSRYPVLQMVAAPAYLHKIIYVATGILLLFPWIGLAERDAICRFTS